MREQMSSSIDQPVSGDDHAARVAAAMPPRAAAFIVTLYGDVVVPRGGELWIGALIETCAQVGISETLVRTAVSRLVAAGQLEGRRRGRRSYYRLTEAARAEYEAAAQQIYGPPDNPGWRFVVLPEDGGEARMAALERAGYARLRPLLAVGPARRQPPEGCLCFEAEADGDLALLPDFAAQAWDLETHAAAYRRLIEIFSPLRSEAAQLDPDTALAVRLLLVHAWRGVLLRDPRLPEAALPTGWPGDPARSLFGRLYRALSPAADSAVAARFEGIDGPLRDETGALRARQAVLGSWAKTEQLSELDRVPGPGA